MFFEVQSEVIEPFVGLPGRFLLFLMQVYRSSFESQPSVKAFSPLFFSLLRHYLTSKKEVQTNIWSNAKRGPERTQTFKPAELRHQRGTKHLEKINNHQADVCK